MAGRYCKPFFMPIFMLKVIFIEIEETIFFLKSIFCFHAKTAPTKKGVFILVRWNI
jgi:hypothetical protein